MDNREYIVLAIDLNNYVISSEAALKIQNLRLIEAIMDRHHLSGLVPTYQWGKVPIDGIFISSSISITSGGYFLLGIAPSDYRALWVKLSISQAFGHVLHKIPPFLVEESNMIILKMQINLIHFMNLIFLNLIYLIGFSISNDL